MTEVGVAIAAIAAFVLIAILIGLDRLSVRIVRPQPRPFERTVPELDVPYEDLEIPAGEGTLAGWLLTPTPARPLEPLVLLAHGWGANYSTVLRLGEPLACAGYDVLLFDVQGHGRNPPVDFVTVRHFRDDLIAVTRYAAKRFPDRQLIVVGHSMGGAAGILAAADGAPINGLVLIAAPADVPRVTAEFLTDQGMPGSLLVSLLRPFWCLRLRSSFRSLTPWRRIREVHVPMMLIQPEHDSRVLRHHADQLTEASGVQYRLVRGREHTDVLSALATVALVEEFLERV